MNAVPGFTRLLSACFFFLAITAGIPLHAGALISYSDSIQPILEQKCVACHACNDAPCQLNLGSAEGLLRGASKAKVYDGTRRRVQPPSRLFIDAEGASAWHARGFASVLGARRDVGNAAVDAETSLLARMLAMGHEQPFAANSKLPDSIPIGTDFEKQCPLDDAEFTKFARDFPLRGMPHGVAGLSAAEFATMNAWLAQGAPFDAQPVVASEEEALQVAEWEQFFNQPGPRERLVARWLYEHLFLAHLHFTDIRGSHFFELVRSRSGSGQPIELIATAQPNESPGAGHVYYRLRPVQGAIVHKTHITYPLNAEKLERIKKLFFSSNWDAGAFPSYDMEARSNPFVAFAAIPPRARYQFMLDNAEYFIRTFIRGPVCRGNIATDVIRDNFWTFFQAPDRDLYITDAGHRAAATPLLGVSGQKAGLADLFFEWAKYTSLRNEYAELRNRDYNRLQPAGAAFSDIWDGDGSNDNAVMSIYRQFDSASVRKGLWGEVPQTMWLIDYPLLERIYYSLVVDFNVFDTASHQAQTRLYFDLMRHSAETDFLRLMPAHARQAMFDDWYQGSGKLKVWLYYPELDTRQPSAIAYRTTNPQAEFAGMLLGRLAAVNARPDPINRCVDARVGAVGCLRADMPAYVRAADQAFSRLAARRADGLPVINFLPEASILRVHAPSGAREIYTMLRNRAHSNVAYMAGESLRYQPERDTLTIYPGVLSSYPNFAFNIPAAEVDEFAVAMQAASLAADFTKIVQRWGVRRTHPDFWKLFHDYTDYMREHEPVEAAILDMNRYQNL